MKSPALYAVILAKASGGPGSKGGKVIGQTRSGQPIYARGGARSKKYAEYSTADHDDARKAHLKVSDEYADKSKEAMAAHKQALSAGDHDKALSHIKDAVSHMEMADKHAGVAVTHAKWDYD